jgi:hypothetical protein
MDIDPKAWSSLSLVEDDVELGVVVAEEEEDAVAAALADGGEAKEYARAEVCKRQVVAVELEPLGRSRRQTRLS